MSAQSNNLDSIKTKSSICLPIVVSLSYLEQLLEKEISRDLYSEKNIDVGYGLRLDLNVIRNGKIQLKTQQLALETQAPIKIAALLRWDAKEKLKLNLQKNQNFDAELLVSLRTTFEIGKNWQLKPQTQAQYKWIKEPSFTVFGISVNIGKFVDPALKRQLSEVTQMIDKEVQKNIVLQKELDNLLQKLALPIPILEKNNFLWLVAKPTDIGVRQVEDKNNLYLRFQAFIQMDLTTVISKVPPPPSAPVKITHNNTAATFCEQSSFLIPIIADYSTLTQVAKEILAPQKITISKKYKVQIKDLQLNYKNEKLCTNICFDLIKKDKKIYPSKLLLSFKPVFNEHTQQFWVENLQYQMHSSHFLLKVGNKLFPKKICQKMDTAIESNVAKAMQEFKSSLKKGLKFSDKDLHLAIDTQVLKSDILAFAPNEARLSLIVDALALIKLKLE
ncbi:MAG: DUF4403 family protein [Bacteroidia bacterium]|nr:DUF4403 family protein [Bacteroidia bacterium]MDW8159732.1 DUF4403 family protein [Bacteroidia bacterium]